MSQTTKVGRTATVIGTEKGITYVQYHRTKVVQWDENTVTLRTGGWGTVTTKLRMNQTANQFDLGFSVIQRDFEWFVQFKSDLHASGYVDFPFDAEEMTFQRDPEQLLKRYLLSVGYIPLSLGGGGAVSHG